MVHGVPSARLPDFQCAIDDTGRQALAGTSVCSGELRASPCNPGTCGPPYALAITAVPIRMLFVSAEHSNCTQLFQGILGASWPAKGTTARPGRAESRLERLVFPARNRHEGPCFCRKQSAAPEPRGAVGAGKSVGKRSISLALPARTTSSPEPAGRAGRPIRPNSASARRPRRANGMAEPGTFPEAFESDSRTRGLGFRYDSPPHPRPGGRDFGRVRGPSRTDFSREKLPRLPYGRGQDARQEDRERKKGRTGGSVQGGPHASGRPSISRYRMNFRGRRRSRGRPASLSLTAAGFEAVSRLVRTSAERATAGDLAGDTIGKSAAISPKPSPGVRPAAVARWRPAHRALPLRPPRAFPRAAATRECGWRGRSS